MSNPSAVPDGVFVDVDWLAGALTSENIAIVDSSWYLPAQHRDPNAEYCAGHIPGARLFSIDAIADRQSSLPHMLPSPEEFARHMDAMGIGNDDRVVIYDGAGLFSAPRVWWMFRVFGHTDVHILRGGLPAWRDGGFQLEASESGAVQAEQATETLLDSAATGDQSRYRSRFNSDLLISLSDLRVGLTARSLQVLDARAPGRFAGTEPEPRPGLRAGHMPGAINLPFPRLLTANGQEMLAQVALRQVFDDHGIDRERPIATSCGSGITACILALGLHLIGRTDVAVYDGSWAEWGSHPDVGVVTDEGDDASASD